MRRHRAPPHCDRCWEVFETEELRFTHNRTVECQILPPKQLEGITDVQKQHLVQRVSARNTREENWYLIYEYLFPNSPRPTSPCKLISLLLFNHKVFLESGYSGHPRSIALDEYQWSYSYAWH